MDFGVWSCFFNFTHMNSPTSWILRFRPHPNYNFWIWKTSFSKRLKVSQDFPRHPHPKIHPFLPIPWPLTAIKTDHKKTLSQNHKIDNKKKFHEIFFDLQLRSKRKKLSVHRHCRTLKIHNFMMNKIFFFKIFFPFQNFVCGPIICCFNHLWMKKNNNDEIYQWEIENVNVLKKNSINFYSVCFFLGWKCFVYKCLEVFLYVCQGLYLVSLERESFLESGDRVELSWNGLWLVKLLTPWRVLNHFSCY